MTMQGYSCPRFERCVGALSILPSPYTGDEIWDDFEGRIKVESAGNSIDSLREFLSLRLGKAGTPSSEGKEALGKFQSFLVGLEESRGTISYLEGILDFGGSLPNLKLSPEKMAQIEGYRSRFIREHAVAVMPTSAEQKDIDELACSEMINYMEGFLSFIYENKGDNELTNRATWLIECLLSDQDGDSHSAPLLQEWAAYTRDFLSSPLSESLFIKAAAGLSSEDRAKFLDHEGIRDKPDIRLSIENVLKKLERGKQPKRGALVAFFLRLLALLMALFSYFKKR